MLDSLECFINSRSIAVFGSAQAQEVTCQSGLMGYDGEIWPLSHAKTRPTKRVSINSYGLWLYRNLSKMIELIETFQS